MVDAVPDTKVILYVFSLYSTIMLGLVAWIGVTMVETGLSVSSIQTEIVIQIPRIIAEQEKIRILVEQNSRGLLELKTVDFPYLKNLVNKHNDDHDKSKHVKEFTFNKEEHVSNKHRKD